MGISLLLSFGLMAFQGVPFSWTFLLLIPIIAILYVISFGLGMILMHYGVTLNDLSNLTNIALKMVFYVSGIFYNITNRLSGILGIILVKVNPIAFCMNEARRVCVYGQVPSFLELGIWLIIGFGLCMIGINVIHKYENSYAKVI